MNNIKTFEQFNDNMKNIIQLLPVLVSLNLVGNPDSLEQSSQLAQKIITKHNTPTVELGLYMSSKIKEGGLIEPQWNSFGEDFNNSKGSLIKNKELISSSWDDVCSKYLDNNYKFKPNYKIEIIIKNGVSLSGDVELKLGQNLWKITAGSNPNEPYKFGMKIPLKIDNSVFRRKKRKEVEI